MYILYRRLVGIILYLRYLLESIQIIPGSQVRAASTGGDINCIMSYYDASTTTPVLPMGAAGQVDTPSSRNTKKRAPRAGAMCRPTNGIRQQNNEAPLSSHTAASPPPPPPPWLPSRQHYSPFDMSAFDEHTSNAMSGINSGPSTYTPAFAAKLAGWREAGA